MALARAMFLCLGTARGLSFMAPARRLMRTSGIYMEATGPVCIVTGGSRGLGRSIALALGSEGCKVVVNYASSAAAAEAVVEEIKGLGGDGIAVQADMSSTEGIKSLFTATADAFDEPVGVLVNNAGITRDTLAMRMKESQWTDVINTNLNGCAAPTEHMSSLARSVCASMSVSMMFACVRLMHGAQRFLLVSSGAEDHDEGKKGAHH